MAAVLLAVHVPTLAFDYLKGASNLPWTEMADERTVRLVRGFT